MFEEYFAKIGVETGRSHSANTLNSFGSANALNSSGSANTLNSSGSASTLNSSGSAITSTANTGKKDPGRRWLASQKEKISSVDPQSELDRYLSANATEDIPIDDDDFDILTWWKVNSTKYRVLAMIARDVLAIPISTVASEAAFSTGGRVVDDYRSNLSPKMTEALICAQNWLLAKQSISELATMLTEHDNFQETDDVVNIPDGSEYH